MGVVFFCILIPSCIERTDVGKLINKSLGDVEVRLRIHRLQEGREMFCRIIHSQHLNITSVCPCVCVRKLEDSLSACTTNHLLLIPCLWSDT